MLDKVKNLLDYMIYSKDREDSWYPDLMAISSETIISILEDYGYNIPSYMRKLTWNDDYADNAHFIAANTFDDIRDFYSKNKKAFTFTKDSGQIFYKRKTGNEPVIFVPESLYVYP